MILQHYNQGVASGAFFDRANQTSGTAAFRVNGASDVTLSNLSITGAYDGVIVNNSATNFTLENSRIFGNASSGVALSSGASTIRDTLFWGDQRSEDRNQNYGVYSYNSAADLNFLRNTFYHVNGQVGYGVYADIVNSITLQDNIAYGNYDAGFYINANNFLVTGNASHDNYNRGFYMVDNGAAVPFGVSHDNTAYNNITGYELRTAGEHYNNTAHHNSTYGFYLYDGVNVHNITAYSNSWGVSVNRTSLRD